MYCTAELQLCENNPEILVKNDAGNILEAPYKYELEVVNRQNENLI